MTPSVKNQLLGEAKFLRAFSYFYLVNLYGDVPLILSSDWQINAKLSRTSKDLVYDQIINDLQEAKSLLSSNYLKSDAFSPYPVGTEERVRPTKWAATSLLSRAYLYKGDNVNAELQASEVISNSLFSLNVIADVFKKNSKESIWQLQPVISSTGVSANTSEGRLFILPTTGPNVGANPVYLSKILLGTFEAGDQRKMSWTNSVIVGLDTFYYPFKYKIGSTNTPTSEYSTVFRVAEQYLIRAEARAKQNNLSGAIADIDMIRQRAGLLLIANTNPGISQSALLTAILHERQVELFTEWGHRWFDLKRTGVVNTIMPIVAPQKGGTWNSNSQLYPIPLSEIQIAPQLIQNSGY